MKWKKHEIKDVVDGGVRIRNRSEVVHLVELETGSEQNSKRGSEQLKHIKAIRSEA